MPGLLETIHQYKDILGVVGSGVAALLGIAKTASEIIRGRSRASENEKLLARIESLVAVRQGMIVGNMPEGLKFSIIDSELSEAMRQFTETSRQQEERKVLEEDLTPLQRAFLLFRPFGLRAWIAHILCWSSTLAVILGLFGSAVSEETDEVSLGTFVQNWKDGTYLAILFYLGVLLLARLWAISERKKYLITHGDSAARSRSFGLGTILAVLYAALGITLVIWGATLVSSGWRGALRLVLCGAIVSGCAFTMRAWDTLREPNSVSTATKTALLILPVLLLSFAVIFNVDGIILKTFAHNVVGYWLSWIGEPIIPLVILPLGIFPTFAAIRLLQARKHFSVQGAHSTIQEA